MDYLNHISRSNRPQSKKSIGSLFSKKFILIMAGLLALSILIIIIGNIVGSARNDKDALDQLNVRVSNLSDVSKKYGDRLKTSTLRSLNVSLASVLNNTSNEIAPFITPTDSKNPSPFVATEQPDLDHLTATLDSAHRRGYLDRIFSNEIALRINMLMSLEAEANELTSDATIKASLERSYDSLEKLYKKFSEFSDTSSSVR